VILEDPVAEADRLLTAAEMTRVQVRMVGGVAVNMRCPSIRTLDSPRTYRDLDLCGRCRDTKRIEQLLETLGYAPSRRFNVLNAGERLLFDDPAHGKHVDVFLDVMRMCHDLDLRDRLTLDAQTLPLADLLLSKLQIVEMTERDMLDVLALLNDHALREREEACINLARVREVCAGDWGWWRTAMDNLEKIAVRGDGWAAQAPQRVQELRDFLIEVPKSASWRLRATVGNRKRWYELPEEVR
jgi:hypothetical protein